MQRRRRAPRAVCVCGGMLQEHGQGRDTSAQEFGCQRAPSGGRSAGSLSTTQAERCTFKTRYTACGHVPLPVSKCPGSPMLQTPVLLDLCRGTHWRPQRGADTLRHRSAPGIRDTLDGISRIVEPGRGVEVEQGVPVRR